MNSHLIAQGTFTYLTRVMGMGACEAIELSVIAARYAASVN